MIGTITREEFEKWCEKRNEAFAPVLSEATEYIREKLRSWRLWEENGVIHFDTSMFPAIDAYCTRGQSVAEYGNDENEVELSDEQVVKILREEYGGAGILSNGTTYVGDYVDYCFSHVTFLIELLCEYAKGV